MCCVIMRSAFIQNCLKGGKLSLQSVRAAHLRLQVGKMPGGLFHNWFCLYIGSCHTYADRLVSKREEGLCSLPCLQWRMTSWAQKHGEALSLLKQFCLSQGFPWQGCDSMQPLCQLVFNSTEWLCTYCCCWGMSYKTWTLKPVLWQQQTSSNLSDRPELHGLKNDRQLKYVRSSGNTTWLCLHSTSLLDVYAI